MGSSCCHKRAPVNISENEQHRPPESDTYARLPYTPVEGTAHHFWNFKTMQLEPSTPITPPNQMIAQTDRTTQLIKKRQAALDLLKDTKMKERWCCQDPTYRHPR